MKSECYRELYACIEQMKVIDAHEHLVTEAERLAQTMDVLMLFCHYCICDLGAAGMTPAQRGRIFDVSVPLEERWRTFEPFWQEIRHTSYSRAVLLTVRDIFGVVELNGGNCAAISEKIQTMNRAGLYERVLVQQCGIEKVLTQNFIAAKDDPLFRTVWSVGHNPLWELADAQGLEKAETELGGRLERGGDLRDSVRQWCRDLVRDSGVVGFKTVGLNFDEPSEKALSEGLTAIRHSGQVSTEQRHMLNAAIVHETIAASIELEVPVAIHVGLTWDNWIDFHPIRPGNVVPLLLKYREARFDLYHLGIPWQDEMAIIAKIYPNAWLNLCWCHIISQALTVASLNQLVELVPVNKIIGFGGDYRIPAENIYGHLVMARENIANVLARRVDEGYMRMENAEIIAKKWLYDNAKVLYRL